MAHNFGQVKTPRVYLDFNNYYLNSNGLLHNPLDQIASEPNVIQQFTYLDPYTTKEHPIVLDGLTNPADLFSLYHYGEDSGSFEIPNLKINDCAILSHELAFGGNASTGYNYTPVTMDRDGGYTNMAYDRNLEHLNALPVGTGFSPEAFGSSIWHLDNSALYNVAAMGLIRSSSSGSTQLEHDDEVQAASIGAISMGEYIDFPQSPDMNVTMSREFDNVKTQDTISGKTFSNVTYQSPTFCHGEQPFSAYNYEAPINVDGSINHLSKEYQRFRRTGRRTWGVSFSMISADNMFHAFESGTMDTNVLTSGITDSTYGDISTWDSIPILTDNPIFKLWTYTKGMMLPFIWQPDKDDCSSNGYAIAKIDGNSFEVQQESFERYSVSFDVVEIW